MEKNEYKAVFKCGDLVLSRLTFPAGMSSSEIKAESCSLAVNVWRGLNALTSLSVFVEGIEVLTFTR